MLHLAAPPMPFYIAGGRHRLLPGNRHLTRRHIRVFDLLYVSAGCLYMQEDDQPYEVRAGQALILLPDRRHGGTENCREDTLVHWLHFAVPGAWQVAQEGDAPHPAEEARAGLSEYEARPFTLRVPLFASLPQPEIAEDLLTRLHALTPVAHLGSTPLRQQILFQELLALLAASPGPAGTPAYAKCAQQAASYLRVHYREPLNGAMLGRALNFHPVHIARCMRKEYGCSPMDYLRIYRIEQSKLLLMQTDYSIARIAEEVGFPSPPYFSYSFHKREGVSPSQFRQRFF